MTKGTSETDPGNDPAFRDFIRDIAEAMGCLCPACECGLKLCEHRGECEAGRERKRKAVGRE